ISPFSLNHLKSTGEEFVDEAVKPRTEPNGRLQLGCVMSIPTSLIVTLVSKTSISTGSEQFPLRNTALYPPSPIFSMVVPCPIWVPVSSYQSTCKTCRKPVNSIRPFFCPQVGG